MPLVWVHYLMPRESMMFHLDLNQKNDLKFYFCLQIKALGNLVINYLFKVANNY